MSRGGRALRIRAAAGLPPIDAGLDDAQLRYRNAVGRERARRPLARRDHAPNVAERAPLDRGESLGLLRLEARLERDRMMHERHERETPRLVGEHAVEAR